MIHTFKQGSDGWRAYKCGKVSASRIIDIMPGTKGNYLASRKNYMAELICEILTGQSGANFVSPAMARGTETEALARSAYEAITGNMVDEIGFIDHDTIIDFGASPDGLVNLDGCIEIKCPNTATHIDTLINGTIKIDYIYQMQTVMLCGNRQWCDFISFDNRLNDKLSIWIKRINRNDSVITSILAEVSLFKKELADMLNKLKTL